MCTGELVLKDRMQCFAICISYKEHSWEEVRVLISMRNWRSRWSSNSLKSQSNLVENGGSTQDFLFPFCVNL